MYIPDKMWDETISFILERIEYLDSITGIDPLSEDGRQLKCLLMALHSIVNINDHPIPRKKLPSKQQALKRKAVKDRNKRILESKLLKENQKNTRS